MYTSCNYRSTHIIVIYASCILPKNVQRFSQFIYDVNVAVWSHLEAMDIVIVGILLSVLNLKQNEAQSTRTESTNKGVN